MVAIGCRTDDFGKTFSLNGIYKLLNRHRFTCLMPRPKHPRQDPAVAKAFRGRLRRQRKSGSTHPKISQQSAHLNEPATLNSFRSCLKVIDTFHRLMLP
jgi:hypothetical protein